MSSLKIEYFENYNVDFCTIQHFKKYLKKVVNSLQCRHYCPKEAELFEMPNLDEPFPSAALLEKWLNLRKLKRNLPTYFISSHTIVLQRIPVGT